MGGPTGGGWGASVGLSSDPLVYNSSFFLVCVPASIAVLPDEYLKRVRPALYARGGPPPLQTSPYYSVERPENPPSRVFRNTHSVFRPPPYYNDPLIPQVEHSPDPSALSRPPSLPLLHSRSLFLTLSHSHSFSFPRISLSPFIRTERGLSTFKIMDIIFDIFARYLSGENVKYKNYMIFLMDFH